MNIKETEARTGMTRANIRYYEAEGLIAPMRKENGYRKYAGETIRYLNKKQAQQFDLLCLLAFY